MRKYKNSHYIGREKYCPDCQEYWPMDWPFFYRSSNTTDGYDKYCIDCRKKRARLIKERRINPFIEVIKCQLSNG